MLSVSPWGTLTPAERDALLARPAQALAADIQAAVADILAQVRAEGDPAVARLTQRFDGVAVSCVRVSAAEMAAAGDHLSAEDRAAMARAAENIRAFHAAQAPAPLSVETSPGVICRRITRPIDPVGLYIPGGSAPLFSTLLMLAIPAQLAGCQRIVLATPPARDGSVHPAILYAARLAGVTDIHRIGGAQAIAALAYGTQTVPRCAKIFGPGNAYVTAAKQAVSADPDGAAIDMPAGPSELLVVADDTADPMAVAADLLSQAEHDPASQVVLVTPHVTVAQRVAAEIQRQLPDLPRRAIAEAALAHSRAILVTDLSEAVSVSNAYGPEHLILNVAEPEALLEQVTTAGSVFLGPFAAEAMGDYASGTNHVLPTYGFARAYSGVNLSAFLKSITVQSVNAEGLRDLGPAVARLAALEGLDAHRLAVTRRLDKLNLSQQEAGE